MCLYPCLFLLELCCHEACEALQLKMSTLEKGCFLAQDWLLLHSSGARWFCTYALSSWDDPTSVILFFPNPALFWMNSCRSQYKADRTTGYVTMCLQSLSEGDCVGGRGLSGEIGAPVECSHFWASILEAEAARAGGLEA